MLTARLERWDTVSATATQGLMVQTSGGELYDTEILELGKGKFRKAGRDVGRYLLWKSVAAGKGGG